MVVDPDLPRLEPTGRRFLAWSSLVRAVGLAGDARKLVLSLIGIALLLAGWWLIDWICGFRLLRDVRIEPGSTLRVFDQSPLELWNRSPWLVLEPAWTVVAPFTELFARNASFVEWVRALARGVWALVVWGIIGGAIARIAVVQLTSGGGIGVSTALRYALRRWVPLIVAPLTPFLAVFLIAAGCAAFGLLYWIPAGIGASIAGILGFIPILAGILMALILLGLALGWPLMIATVATEGEDLADSLSRSYSYVNQRALRYLAHLGVAWVLGILGLILALSFGRLVLGLADWSVALGAPARPTTIPLANLTRQFWTETVGWLAHAYLYSYFWTTISVIYLVLRRDVDGTDSHDVYLDEQANDTFAGPTALTISDLPEQRQARSEL